MRTRYNLILICVCLREKKFNIVFKINYILLVIERETFRQ